MKINAKGILAVIAMLIMVLSISGCYSQQAPSTATAVKGSTQDYTPGQQAAASAPAQGGCANNGVVHEIEIVGYKFNPQELDIAKCDSVKWTNSDSVPHTITGDSAEINSQSLNQGDAYVHVFENAGTYAYHCSIHPSMKGTIIVK